MVLIAANRTRSPSTCTGNVPYDKMSDALLSLVTPYLYCYSPQKSAENLDFYRLPAPTFPVMCRHLENKRVLEGDCDAREASTGDCGAPQQPSTGTPPSADTAADTAENHSTPRPPLRAKLSITTRL